MEVTDPVTGRRIVREVSYLHERFEGPHVEQLPDIAVFWDNSFHWNAVESPRFGILEIPPQDQRSGSHSDHAFLLASGPGIPPGITVNGCTPLDIPAWVLDTAGVPLPDHLDGRPIRLSALPKSGRSDAARNSG